jgi:hypothetical protein
VRRRNCGVNGKVVLFYARRLPTTTPKPRPTKPPTPPRAPAEGHIEVLDGVRALGMTQATAAQVAEAVRESFPNGTGGVAVGEMIRAVFLRLRKNTGDKVG